MNNLLTKYRWAPWVIIGLMAFFYNYHQTIFKGPMSRHQWRQADALSMTKNYLEGSGNFLDTQIHFQHLGEGHGVGEFPIIYYLNAGMWKVFGEYPFFPRMVTFVFLLLGLAAIQRIAFRFTQDLFWSWTVPVALFCAPLFVYYGNNFLVNIPALALVFMSWNYAVKYYDENKKRFIWWAIITMSLAGLLRATMLIGMIPYFIILAEIIWKGRRAQQGISLKGFVMLAIIPVVISVIWIMYIKQYNARYESIYFLTTTRPIWLVENFGIHFRKFLYFLWDEFHLSGVRWLFPFVLIFLWLRRQSLWNKWGLTLLAVGISSIVYLILWFNNLDVHDYYMLELYIFFVIALLAVLYAIQEWRPSLFYSTTLRVMAIAGLVWMVYQTSAWQRLRYDPNDKWVQLSMVVDQEHLDRWSYEKWYQDSQLSPFKVMREGKSKFGMTRNTKVVVPQDESPNVTLYFMDLKGFTGLYYPDMGWNERLDMYKGRGAEYLLIRDEASLDTLKIDPSKIQKVGVEGEVTVYRIV